MRKSAGVLKDLFKENLADLGDAIVAQVMRRARAKKDLTAIGSLAWSGENAYRASVRETLAEIALEAMQQARRAAPAHVQKLKLAEKLNSISLKEADTLDTPTAFDDLPSDIQDKIRKRAQLLVDTQLNDLEQTISFQYQNSFDTTDDSDTIENDLNTAAMEYIDGQAINAGAELMSAQTVNDSRSAFFFDADVLDSIAGFFFVNGDPVTEVCQDLSANFGPDSGNYIDKDDPNIFRYTPPLHWNCKSTIEPVYAGEEEGLNVLPFQPSSAAIAATIQFHEHEHLAACRG